MIRLVATNEVGIPFEKAEGLRCVCEGSQELALRMASYEMEVSVQSLDGIVQALFGEKVKREDSNTGAFVITEKTGKPYGAICLFFGGVMEAVYSQIGNFYALPSSVHEWIVIRRCRDDLETLRNMVRDINATELDPSEKLSDDVYEYVGGVFRIAR